MVSEQHSGKAPGASIEGDPARAAEVYYDGGCPICRAEIAGYRKAADDSVRWRDVDAALEEEETAQDLPDRATLLARFHARRADGRLVDGAAAFLAVWRAVPRLAPIARILDRQPFIWIGDVLYAVFLKIRPLWRKART